MVLLQTFTITGAGGWGAEMICLHCKFKFLVEFPIGLHVILQLQIKKFKIAYLKGKIILTENLSSCNLAPLLK